MAINMNHAVNSISEFTLTALSESVFTITDGASVDLDPANGPIQLWTLGANRTATASNFGRRHLLSPFIVIT